MGSLIGIVGAIGGTAMNAFGSYLQGQAAKAQAEYNRAIALRNAQAVRMKSLLDQVRHRRMANRLQGTLRSKLGASGALMTEGAPLAAVAEQAMELDFENALIGYEGMAQAQQDESQAEAFKLRGKYAKEAADIGVGTSLLSGFNTMYESGMTDQIGSWFKKKA
jgi:hypothetical protein